MALFAELDPDPVIRIDLTGKIIQTNDAALLIDKSKKIVGSHIHGLLPFIDFDIKKFIMTDKFAHFTKKINEEYYSIFKERKTKIYVLGW